MFRMIALCLVAVSLAACSKSTPTPAPIPASAVRYTVRGIVTRLPAPPAKGSTRRGVFVHHEPIPTFTNAAGEKIGMGEMTMEFPLSREVSLEGVEPGDKVEVEIAVWYEGRAASWVTTRLKELPADTTLELKDPP